MVFIPSLEVQISHLVFFLFYSKTTSDEENKRPAQAITHTSKEPTYSPTWEEKVTLEMDSSNAGKDGMEYIWTGVEMVGLGGQIQSFWVLTVAL